LVSIAEVNPQLALWATDIAARVAGFIAERRFETFSPAQHQGHTELCDTARYK
jgi:hypothetical protein